MKKKLFYLFALICSMSLFTACGDDEDDTWKQIPTGEISVEGGDAALNINGAASTTGSVQMTVKNESEATLTLKNVIPGYADLNIDVELQKQADNSYKLAGETQVNTAPVTKAVSSDPAILTVEVDGTITLDGKVSLNVTASGPGLFVGTYTDAQLTLKYGGSELVGKTVYYAVTNSTPILTLAYVIPGEATTVISGVYTNKDGAFSGEVTTATGATVTYSGSITVASGMTLNLGVILSADAQGGLTATWPLSHTLYDSYDDWGFPEGSVSVHSPVRVVWEVDGSSSFSPEVLATILPHFASAPLAEVLKDITLSADGNLVANYYSKIEPYYYMDGEWIKCEAENMLGMQLPAEGIWLMTVGLNGLPINPYERVWNSSPKNLLHWYAKGDHIYLMPNIAQILKQMVENQAIDAETLNAISSVMAFLPNLGAMDDAALQGMAQAAISTLLQQLGVSGIDISALDAKLIRQVLGWLTDGIPLKYKMKDGSLYLYVDKGMVDPFMKVLIPLLPILEAQLGQAMPEGLSLSDLLMMFLQVDSLTKLGDAWNNNTTVFELGLNFLNK